jgi:hypothetical protein
MRVRTRNALLGPVDLGRSVRVRAKAVDDGLIREMNASQDNRERREKCVKIKLPVTGLETLQHD